MFTLPRVVSPALAAMLCLPLPVSAEQEKDAFESLPASTDLHLTFEFIEVCLADWSDWLADHPLKNDATELRQTVRGWGKEKKATVFESVTIHARSGQRAKAESVMEASHPTDFDAAAIPQTLSNVHNLVASPGTAVLPKAFETRKIGVTVEVDPVVSLDGKTVDLNLSPEIVRRLASQPWPNAQVDPRFRVETPQFFTAKITTQLTVKPGAPSLVGTVRLVEAIDPKRTDPLVLVFVRADLE